MSSYHPSQEDRLRGIEARLAEIERRLGIGGPAASPSYGTPRPSVAAPSYGVPKPSIDNDPELQQYLHADQPIQAIKRVRELTNWGLKDAKDYVDRLRQRYRY